MKINFIGIFACFLLYFFSCILQKYQGIWLDKLKHLLKMGHIEESSRYRISMIWNFICVYIVTFISISTFFRKSIFSINVLVFRNSRFFSELGMCVLCFLLGILCSNGKKILDYMVENFLSFSGSFAITFSLIFLLRIYENCISQVTLFFSFLLGMCIIHYFFVFQKRKDQLRNLEFIFQFTWILFVHFINSFIFIYCLWNL